MRGASPSDGSSSISRRGRASRARAIASCCCSPPDSLPADERYVPAQDREALEHRLDVRGDRLAIAAGDGAEQEVLGHGQRREDVPALGHERDAAADDRAPAASPTSAVAVELDRAGRRADERPRSPRACSSCRRRSGRARPTISPSATCEVDAADRARCARSGRTRPATRSITPSPVRGRRRGRPRRAAPASGVPSAIVAPWSSTWMRSHAVHDHAACRARSAAAPMPSSSRMRAQHRHQRRRPRAR